MNGSRIVTLVLAVSLLLTSTLAPAADGFAGGTALATQEKDSSAPPGGMGPLPDHGNRADRSAIAVQPGQPAGAATRLSVAANQAAPPPPPAADPREEECLRSGNIWLPKSETCIHGPDPVPPGEDATQRPSPVPAATTRRVAAQAVCDGNGQSGPRVQVLYARASTTTNRYTQYLPSIRTWADGADTIMQASADEAGGSRRIRFVTTAGCDIDVGAVTVSPAGDDSFDNLVAELKTQGFTRSDRIYHVFLDALWGGGVCGVGGTYPDDGPGQANLNNYGPGFGVIQAGCWDDGQTPAHELMHALGAVQKSAPNASRAGHCIDEYDVMCYPDAPDTPPMRVDCADQAHDFRYDCNHDDYFNPSPLAGSYLATHWNAADNRFLVGGGNGGDDDGAPPTVNWVSPVGNDGRYEASDGTVPLEVTASDGSGINRVLFQLYDDAADRWDTLAEDRSPPFTADLAVADLRPGENFVGALAIDAVQDLAFEVIIVERTEGGGGGPVDPPVPLIQLTRPRGIAFDTAAPPNLWITSDAIDSALLSTFPETGPRVDYPYGDISSSQQIGQLATEPDSTAIWMLTQTGGVYFVNTANPAAAGWQLVGNIPAIPVDTSAMYDVATGRIHNGNGVIVPAISSYGDIALLKRASTFDAFVTGESQGFPFVVRLRWSLPSGAFQSAKVVAYSSQTTSLRNTRGIAVNEQGRVLTILPFQRSFLPVDSALFFDADFPEGTGFSPVFLPESLGNFTAAGMTTDAAGRFYAPAHNGTCAAVWTEALIVLNPTLTGGVCYPLPEAAGNMVDVAVNADGTVVFVTGYNSGKVWRYVLPAAPADASPPTTPVLSLVESGGDDPDQHVSGTTLFYNPGAGRAGNVQVSATSSDAESGIASVAFPAVFGNDAATDATSPYSQTYAWSAGASASGAKTVTASNGAGLTSSATFTVTPDAGAPTASLTAPATGATIANGATVGANASDALAGVAQVEFRYCAGATCTFAAGTAIGVDQSAPYSVVWTSQPADGSYTLLARATDRVGNVVDSATRSVTVRNTPADTTPPTTPTLTLTESEPDEYAAGSTLYYNPSPGQSGTFTVAAASADPESGIASIAFPAVFGGDAATDATSPYEATYAWSAGANAAGSRTVTATNGDGLTASAAFTVTPDAAGPSVSLTAPGSGATIANGAAITATASDALSGVVGVEFRYCPGVTCNFAAGTSLGSDQSAPYSATWSNQPPDGAYALIARATDQVGNTTDSAPRAVTIRNTPQDTTPPTAPALTLTETEPDEHRAGTTLYYNPSGNGGSFTVAAETADPDSGIAAVAFPAVFGGDAASDTTSPYERSYTWSTGASASGTKTVTATNGAGLTASSSFSVTSDAAAPTVAITAPNAGATVASGVAIGVDAADALAGVAQVEVRYCPGSSCAFADGIAIGSDAAAPYAVTWTGQPPDGTYSLVARATDNVGNSADSPTRTVTVGNDTTPPMTPTLTVAASGGSQHAAGTRLYYNPSAGNSGTFTVRAESSDPQSGVASVSFPVVFGNDGVVDAAAPFEQTYAWDASATVAGSRTVSVRNGAGLTASADFTVTPDAARPTVAITSPSAGAPLPAGATIQVSADDDRSGVARVEVRVCPGATCAFASGDPVGSDDAAPYAVAWTTQPAAGSYTLVARATDHVGNSQDSASVTVRVGNRAPVNVSAGGPYTVDEGASVVVTGSAIDPDGDPLAFGWDLDADAQVDTLGQSATYSAAGRDGPANRQIAFAVCDSLGACAAAAGNVAIRNVAPAIASVSNSGPVAAGASATVTVAASDPAGAGDPLTYEFDCQNDGQFEVSPQSSPSATCAFPSAGNHPVAVRVRDGDGGSATGTTTVTVRSAELAVSCTASESQSAAVAGAACDGRLDTVWASAPNPIKKKKGKKKKKPKPAPETASVTFDLGAPGNDGPHALGEIRWQFSAGCCDAMSVEVSTNDSSFQSIATVPGRPAADTWQSLAGPSQPVQKIRLVMTAKSARQVGFLREVEFCATTCAGSSGRAGDDGQGTAAEQPLSQEPAATAPDAMPSPEPIAGSAAGETAPLGDHADQEGGPGAPDAGDTPPDQPEGDAASTPDADAVAADGTTDAAAGNPTPAAPQRDAGAKKRGDPKQHGSGGKDDRRDRDGHRKQRENDDHGKRTTREAGSTKGHKGDVARKPHRQDNRHRRGSPRPESRSLAGPETPAQAAADAQPIASVAPDTGSSIDTAHD